MIFQGITITKVAPIITEKGPTYEWSKGVPGLQITLYQRKKGKISGNHFHKGDDPSKNPERFFLIQGRMRLQARNRQGQVMNVIIEEGTELLINSWVFHALEALTDVVFVEYRSTVFNRQKPDTYSEKDFVVLFKESNNNFI